MGHSSIALKKQTWSLVQSAWGTLKLRMTRKTMMIGQEGEAENCQNISTASFSRRESNEQIKWKDGQKTKNWDIFFFHAWLCCLHCSRCFSAPKSRVSQIFFSGNRVAINCQKTGICVLCVCSIKFNIYVATVLSQQTFNSLLRVWCFLSSLYDLLNE